MWGFSLPDQKQIVLPTIHHLSFFVNHDNVNRLLFAPMLPDQTIYIQTALNRVRRLLFFYVVYLLVGASCGRVSR